MYSEKVAPDELEDLVVTRWAALGGDPMAMLPKPPRNAAVRSSEVELMLLWMLAIDAQRGVNPPSKLSLSPLGRDKSVAAPAAPETQRPALCLPAIHA